MTAWRTLEWTRGFPTLLQHANGAVLERVAHEHWQLTFAGRSWVFPWTRFEPTERAERILADFRPG